MRDQNGYITSVNQSNLFEVNKPNPYYEAAQFGILPAKVRYCTSLSNLDKLIYLEMSATAGDNLLPSEALESIMYRLEIVERVLMLSIQNLIDNSFISFISGNYHFY